MSVRQNVITSSDSISAQQQWSAIYSMHANMFTRLIVTIQGTAHAMARILIDTCATLTATELCYHLEL